MGSKILTGMPTHWIVIPHHLAAIAQVAMSSLNLHQSHNLLIGKQVAG